jgi:hypothetical protein
MNVTLPFASSYIFVTIQKTSLMPKPLIVFLILVCLVFTGYGQAATRQLQAARTNPDFKIDGKLEEAEWKHTMPSTKFEERRPT